MPPTGQRGRGPAHPRDFTGTLLKQQQQQKQKQQELETVDISTIEHAAYLRGYDKGYYDGIAWVGDNFDVFELEDEPDEERPTLPVGFLF